MTAAMRVPAAPGWLRTVASPAIGWWMRLDSEGAERIPRRGAVILAPHHRSYADIPAVGAAAGRSLTYLGSAHLTALPVAGRILTTIGLVGVNRGQGDVAALERCLEVLRAGAAVVIFPEGGRSRDGQVYRPRSGVARLANAAGCPVVPVGVSGTERVWPPGHWPRPTRGRVRVRFGHPLEAPAADPASRREFAEKLHMALAELSGAPRAPGFLPPPRAA